MLFQLDAGSILICQTRKTADGLKHQIGLFRQRRLFTQADIIFPEVLQEVDRVFLVIKVPINSLPHEIIFMVGKEACNVCDIDVHNAHVVAHLELVMARHTSVGPEILHVVVGRLTLQNGFPAIREDKKSVHISQQEREKRMLIHRLIPVYGEPGLLGKDLSNHILQQVANGKCDRLVRLLDSWFNPNLVEVQISCRFVWGKMKGGSDIATANPLLPPGKPLFLC